MTIIFITDECHDFKSGQLLFLNLKTQLHRIKRILKGKHLIPITGWVIVGFRFNFTVPRFPGGLHFFNEPLMDVNSYVDTAHLKNTILSQSLLT